MVTEDRHIRQESGEKKGNSFLQSLKKLMSSKVSERSQEIIRARFGLDGQAPKTLESIGKKYDITRERVRQIIRGVVREVDTSRNASVIKQINATVFSTLENHHGIMTEEALYAELSQGDSREEGALRFFIENFSSLQPIKETTECRQALALPSFSMSHWKSLIRKVSDVLKESGKPMTSKKLKEAVLSDERFAGMEAEIFDFLAVAREIKKSVFRRWGFVKWSDIEPRGAREKAFLVLKAEKKPLHFREIAALIDAYNLQKRGHKTHYQTVHNELIKDKRFVLVGRGIYALAEWGYKRGTVREILSDILTEAKEPLDRQEILSRVAQVRRVKRSTVIINLNTFFARVGKGSYTLKKK